ncbi:MAG: hypothetical protein HQL97_01045 [Magnetococcales bacterium]|nr:hypothetical protein [Magnetococcales bacterium]
MTDVPGRVMAALGLPTQVAAQAGVEYVISQDQARLRELISEYGMTNADIARRTKSAINTANIWTLDPWARSHTPIPPAKLALLESSVLTDTPTRSSGRGPARKNA